MTNMDRLFGKELSNILEPSLLHKKRNIGRYQTKVRGISVDDANKNVHKKYLSHVSQNQSLVTKVQQQSQIKDIQMVPTYFDQCLAHMFKQQESQYKLNNYLKAHSQITQKMRGILLDWLFDLHYKFKMFPQTLYTVVMIIDRYLCGKDIGKDKLQLVGTASFFIAAKYEQTYQVPQLDDLVHFAAKTFTKQDIIKMEAQIINELNFDLITITSFRFFQALGKLSKMQTKNFHLAQYVLQLSLLEGKFLQYKPSLVGSASIYLINKIRKRNQSWPDLLVAATGYQQKELKTCARQLCYLLEKAEDLPNTKALRKKFSTSQFNEVTRVKLQRRK